VKWDVSVRCFLFLVPNWGASVNTQPLLANNGLSENAAFAALPLGIRQYMLKTLKQYEQPFRVFHTAAARFHKH